MIAPQLLFDWMHQAPIYSETDNLGEVWTTASVTCPQDLFHFRCLRHQFSTFEADPYPTRSCPWKCTNIRLCRLCPLLVIYYLHFYKIDRISRATFFFFWIFKNFSLFSRFWNLSWYFVAFWRFSFLLVSSRFFVSRCSSDEPKSSRSWANGSRSDLSQTQDKTFPTISRKVHQPFLHKKDENRQNTSKNEQ